MKMLQPQRTMREHHNDLFFARSASTEENPYLPGPEVLAWLADRKSSAAITVRQVPFRELEGWCFDGKGNLRHQSGRFFTVEGLEVETNWGTRAAWNQPIIRQAEIGILGILAKNFDGVPCFLLQAKTEPGNVDGPQFSPTLQATRSNYTRAHEGRAPFYLPYFTENLKGSAVLIDQLQSEQGARFLQKRNRNIVLNVHGDVPVHENFCWLTLGQIYRLLTRDNVVNMDTRSVISTIPLNAPGFAPPILSGTGPGGSERRVEFAHTMLCGAICPDLTPLLSWIATCKSKYRLRTRSVGLTELPDWEVTGGTIAHRDRPLFSVIGVAVEIGGREVNAWCQPLFKPAGNGIVALIAKKFAGAYYFLVQARVEGGHLDVVELAPTVQCLTADYRTLPRADWPPFLEYVLAVPEERVVLDTLQSEEGGRFFREQTRHVLVIANDDFADEIPEDYRWATLDELKLLGRFNNFLNIELRSLISVTSAAIWTTGASRAS